MIYPMLAMILLTFGYAGYTAYGRVKAVKNREVDIRYYRTMSGYDIPHRLQIATRHFNNLLETPPLFYIAAALIIATELESGFTAAVGWIYFGSRVAHMYIHNTYNFPLHRMMAFFIGWVCIATLWIVLAIRL